MKKLTHSIVILFCCMFCHLSYAEVYEHEFSPPKNIDPEGYAHYKLYIPEKVDTIKGVYCYVPGWQGSSLNQVDDINYQVYVEEKGFALMGMQMLGSYTDYYEGISLWSGEALVNALKALALQSNHPELEFSALLFDGHSAGGQFSYHFTQWKPERVIGFVTMKGGYHSLSPAGDAIHVPGYMFIGENDEEHRLINLTTIFENNRPNGALWCLAKEPGAYHERIPKDIVHSYFNEIIPLRIPEKIPFDTIPILKKIPEQNGWLGNRVTFSIDAFAEYQGNKGEACWFPNKKIAQEWLQVVQKNYNAVDPTKDFNLIIYPNPAKNSICIENENRNSEVIAYHIVSASGQIAKQGNLKTDILEIMDLEKGIYILSLKTNCGAFHKKFVVE